MPLTYLSPPADYREKERLYLEVRNREGRVLTDEALKQLPEVNAPAALAREWRWRKRTYERFDAYLNRHYPDRLVRVLDLGCGNGWMSNLLAMNQLRSVTAVDLNETELEQGSRVFRRHNLQFAFGDALQGALPENSFEVIVLAASVQYFPDLRELVAALRRLLAANGSIHFLDSHFYKNESERDAARQRSFTYYQGLGVPEMGKFYHHHLWQEARELGAVNLNGRPDVYLLQRLGRLAPFPWLRLV
ncbi:MAG TPA: class I SAM-dependent methyltransferase [Saprospiraceae bacterium]|nr:class I SAM-dependent methyltransferase [Saprospiraceae bacterium]